MPKIVETYDTTLRDGAQSEGISFSLSDKLRITQELDSLGIQYIEGGYPGSNPKDIEYFKAVRKLKLERKEEREQAVQAMWDWFQDWAKTARTVVKNRNYQVMLGLTTPHRSPKETESPTGGSDSIESETV